MDNPIFLDRFARTCADACARGWHEANGGNLSYRLSEEDVAQCKDDLAQAGTWNRLQRAVPRLAGAHFLMTASGAYLSNIAYDLMSNAGIIQINEDGTAWCPVWGFEHDARPSSELETHLAAYEVGPDTGDGADRVIYHAHSPYVIALSAVLEPNARTWTRALWKIMTEGIIMFPQGVGAMPWMVPGSSELAQATVECMATYKVCVWAHHGIMARAKSFDEAFGIVDTVEKSAGIYLQACAANGGNGPRYLVSDDQLRAICERYGIAPNPEFLD